MTLQYKQNDSGSREVERAAKPTQQTPYKGKWQETDEKLSPKDAKVCRLAC